MVWSAPVTSLLALALAARPATAAAGNRPAARPGAPGEAGAADDTSAGAALPGRTARPAAAPLDHPPTPAPLDHRPTPAPPTLTPLARPLTLAPGSCEASLVVESNLSVRRRFDPLSAAPDVHCGVHRRLTLGVTHSARSLSLVDSGHGLCLAGDGCTRLYDDTAVDALTSVVDGDAALAGRARLVAASYDLFKPSLRVGVLMRLRRGRAAVLLDPHLALGLAHRDRGNRDQLNVPVVAQLALGARVVVSVRTGVRGELAVFGDAFAVPVGAGVQVSPLPEWDIGLEAAFPKLLGPQNTFRQRHLALFLTRRLRMGHPSTTERDVRTQNAP